MNEDRCEKFLADEVRAIHEPVLLREILDLYNINPGGRYVDGTLGAGGHAEAVLRCLNQNGKLLGLEVDAQMLTRAKSRLQPLEDQTITRQVNFRGLQEVFRSVGWSGADGMLFDLGVSSFHLDQAARGFSFLRDGPLDMRLNADSGENALDYLARTDETEFADHLRNFGLGGQSKKVSRYLLHDIRENRIKTTMDLAGFCNRVIGRFGRRHSGTKLFLAIRCLVNDELGALSDLLRQAPDLLNVEGRLLIITFHSLEDRMVKQSFRELANTSGLKKFRLLTKKPIVASEEENKRNPRARSAKLRGLERIS